MIELQDVAVTYAGAARPTIAGATLRIDEGEWQPARLATAINADTWVQWVYEWEASSGNHIVQVRATDSEGDTQSSTQVPPAPNGSEGWHTITVSVA